MSNSLSSNPARRTPASRRNRERRRRLLFSELLERRLLLTTIIAVDPAANSHDAGAATDIAATFDQDVIAGTATPMNFVVHGTMSRGQLVGAATTVSAAGPVITHDPANGFAPGEVVHVTATADISTAGGAANSRVWQFRTASVGSGQFVDGGTTFGTSAAEHVALGDVDADGDLDVVLSGSELWLNDGAGGFTDSGQNLGTDLGESGADFADVNGDGSLDLISGTRVSLNNGSGVFTDTGQGLGGGTATAGDLDGDGDLDLVTGVAYAPNRLFFNNGSGQFTDSGQAIGNGSTDGNSFGDFDGDGDLDVLERLAGTPNKIWINDGNGILSDSGQMLGGFRATKDADFGDVDADGDLDFIAGNSYNGAAHLYINAGNGVFAETQALATANSPFIYGAKLADVDGDGDLDFISLDRLTPHQIWLNDGEGAFTDSGSRLTAPRASWGANVGDLDGDGDLDIVEINRSPVGGRLWFNQNLTPNVTLSVDNATIPEEAGNAIITATLSATHTDPVTVELTTSGSATATDDYSISGTQIVIPAGETTGSVTVTAVQDAADENDETVVVDVSSVSNSQELGSQQVTITIIDDDEPPMPDVTLSVDTTEIAEAAGAAIFTVTLSEVTTIPVSVDLAISGTAAAADYTATGTQVVIAPGNTSGSITVTAVQDDVNEPAETVIVDISAVAGGNESGVQQQTVTIIDDDAPPSFSVTSLQPAASGFRVAFSSELDASSLNLYDAQNAGLGPADLVVAGASTGPVAGSLIADGDAITFVKSGGPLNADTYTVRLRSAADGFQDTDARLLDGDGDGTAGDDYVTSFVVQDSPVGARTITIPDFVRGPGQSVNLPANETTGIPITISDGQDVRAADVRIAYDPALLEITGATAPAGGSVVLNTTTTPGVAILVFFSSAALPAGSSTFIQLQASVPASADYGDSQMLDLHAVTIGDGNDNEFPVTVDDSFHFATYFAEVSGNRRINASDAAQVARFAALIDNGFSSSLNADPITVGDISGNGRINAADASRVAQFAALIDVPEIPPLPGGIQITGVSDRPSTEFDGPTTMLIDSRGTNRRLPEEAAEFANTPDTSLLTVDPEIGHLAVDRVMAEAGEPMSVDADEEEFELLLEFALDEIFSPAI